MHHWMDPLLRGVYDHPAAVPPPPRPTTANDIPTRVTRLEEHQQFQAQNIIRVEHGSLMRAKDIGEAITGFHQRLTILEQERHTRRAMTRMAWTSAKSASAFAKYGAAGILAILLMAGKIDLESVKVFLKVLGLPVG